MPAALANGLDELNSTPNVPISVVAPPDVHSGRFRAGKSFEVRDLLSRACPLGNFAAQLIWAIAGE